MAGINAGLRIEGRPPLILERSDAYIGVMIDDLVTKGTAEPYRMFTSRAEYRLLLREDNADLRLMEKGHAVGLVKDSAYGSFRAKSGAITETLKRLEGTRVYPNTSVNKTLKTIGSVEIKKDITLKELLRRQEVDLSTVYILMGWDDMPEMDIAEQVEIQVKYEGYIKRQQEQVERFRKMEGIRIPEKFVFEGLSGLSKEIKEKLGAVRPESIGQASRISGMTPAAISVLLVNLKKERCI
jgi:tRNA uridine 5-carboxymethylaminomethyl modification enzyme